MRRIELLIGSLIGFFVAGACLAQDSEHAALNVPRPDWRRVEVHLVAKGEVAERYRRLQATQQGYPDTPEGAQAFLARYPRFFQPGTALVDSFDGDWRFEASFMSNWPTMALQRVDESTDDAYRMAVHVWCEDSSDCKKLVARANRALAIEPLGHRQTAQAQWTSIVYSEPCEPGPPHQAHMRFPPGVAGGAASVTMKLAVTVNACGDIRGVGIVQSSRDRFVDRVVYDAMLKSRIAASRTYALLPMEINLR